MDASLMQTSSQQVSASAMSASQEQQQQPRGRGRGGEEEEDALEEEKNLTTANNASKNNNASENSTSEEEEMVKKTSPEANAKTAKSRRRNKSMFRDISRRQWDPRYHKECTQTQCMKHPSIIKGMRLLKNLEKHGGCVNTVSWNEDASLLISGSDDMTVVVWSTGTNFPVKGSVFTGHTHNVFDAQFVPNCNSTKCVTTAADGQVRMIDLERGFAEKPPNHHTNRYMRNINLDSPAAQQLWSGDGAGMGMKLIFLPGSATSFLSTHQDGCVRLFDIREGTRSRREVVIDLASVGAASDIAFDPTAPHTFAVGCDDPIVRVFDIRHHVAKLTRTSEDYYSHAGSPGTSPVLSPTGFGAMRRGGFYNGGSPSSTVGSPGTPTGVGGGGGGGGGYSSSPGGASGLPSSFGLPSSPPSRSSGFVERCLPTVAEYCPGLAFGAMKKFQGEEELMRSSFRSRRFEGISGIAFSKTGELACTYKGEDVYVLETRKVVSSVKIDLFKHDSMDELEKRYEGCAKKYEGRKNTRTFLKGVAFMCGDEYVTTGGDCGNIFVWNKKTTELVCKLPGDSQVVNNVIPHPHLPVLAASGIDSDIKIFEASKDGEHIEEPPRKGERDNDFDSSDEDDEDDEEIDGEEYVQINTPGGHVIQIPGRSLIELLRRRQEGRDGGIDPLLLEEEEGSDEDEDEDEDNSNDSDDSDDDDDDDDDDDYESSSSSSSSSSSEEESSEYEDTGSGRREDELDGFDEELAMSEADEEDEQMEDAEDSFEENNVEQQQR
jgi:WD40 repeat protein